MAVPISVAYSCAARPLLVIQLTVIWTILRSPRSVNVEMYDTFHFKRYGWCQYKLTAAEIRQASKENSNFKSPLPSADTQNPPPPPPKRAPPALAQTATSAVTH